MTGRSRGMVVAEDITGEIDDPVGREEREGTVTAPNIAEELSDAPTEEDVHDIAEDGDLDVQTNERDDVPSSIHAKDASIPNAFDRLASGSRAGTASRAPARAPADDRDLRPGPATVPCFDAPDEDAKCAACARGSHRRAPPDDAVACPVCLEPCAISGPHQAAALACGHVFGCECIKKWLEKKKKKNGGRCPQCNARAAVKDVRLLFVPSFHAFVDTEELDSVKAVLREQRAARVDAETTAARVSRRLVQVERDLEASRERAEALEAEARAAADKLARVERQLLKRKAAVDDGRGAETRLAGVARADATPDVAPVFEKAAASGAATEPPTRRGALRDWLEPNGRRVGFGYREGCAWDDAKDSDARAERAREAREDARRRRSAHLASGRFVRRACARVRRARAFDANGVVAAVGERVERGGRADVSDVLTKISLRAPDASRVCVALPAGAGHVRDVRLTNGGTAALRGGGGGRALALAATQGKKLLVVDLDRDHVAARVDLPHAAWSCAWGGWAATPPRFVTLPGGAFRVAPAAPSPADARGDPSGDPNLCVVGGANGEALMYDLRSTRAALARVRPPTRWVGSDARPVHTVIPLSNEHGGGLLYGTCAGVRAFAPAPSEDVSSRARADDAGADRAAPDADGAGVVLRVPGVDACGAALAFAPGARAVVATAREEPRAGGSGGVVFAKHVVREWDRSLGEGEWSASRGARAGDVSGSVSVTTRAFPWWAGPDAMHARARVTCRAALTGPRDAALAGLIACGSLSVRGEERRNVVALTDAVSGERFPDLEHGGSGHVEDVRGWCGDSSGGVEVLASLGADAMTVFSWDASSR